MRRFLLASFVLFFLAEPTAFAYPTAVVFAPTGEVTPQAHGSVFAYTAMNLGPKSSPSVSWLGFEVGLLPPLSYGDSELSFGGLEIGVDLMNADLYGTEDAYVKPLVNAKLGVLAETDWMPSLAVGTMGLALVGKGRERSQNAVYVAGSKTLSKYGSVTLGLARYFTDDPSVFDGTFPLENTRLGLLAGYASPSVGAFSFAIDHVGGYGEINTTNVAVNISPMEGGMVAVGGYFSNKRADGFDYDGVFAYLYLYGDFLDR